jgi:hypothetical protein
MTKQCAYCGNQSKLTREHIWPSGFLRRDEFGVKFSARANKTFKGDLTIADVCADCNNGPLSVLDRHACELYDRRFAKLVEASTVVTFTYDYGLLMRWLLKLSYNSARTTGWDAEMLSCYRDTILSSDPCTPVFAVAFLATVAPLEMVNRKTKETRKIYPIIGRCGPLLIPGIEIDDLAVIRCVMINAFYFTIVVSRSTSVDKIRFSQALNRIPGKPLNPSGRMRVGPPSLPAHVALQGIESWPSLR